MSTTMTTHELSSFSSPEQISPTLEREAAQGSILRTQDQLGGNSVEMHSKSRAAIIITTVAGVNFLNVMGSGILTVALPTIAEDLGLSTELLLWPASIYA
jgi:hypothetical protein